MARSVNPRVDRGESAQGFYIAGADGTGFGWVLTADPDRTLAFLRVGLEKFRDRPLAEAPAELEAEGIRLRPEAATTVVRVYCRVAGLPRGADAIARSVGRDHLWIYRDEARSLGLAARRARGDFPFPATLVARIARFHLIDTSGGNWGGWWSGEEVRAAAIRARVTGRSGRTLRLRFSGAFRMESATGGDGLTCRLEGDLEIEPGRGAIRRFRTYGEGDAWGDHSWQRRFGQSPPDPRPRYRLRFAMMQTTDAVSVAVPPVALFHGAGYATAGAGGKP